MDYLFYALERKNRTSGNFVFDKSHNMAKYDLDKLFRFSWLKHKFSPSRPVNYPLPLKINIERTRRGCMASPPIVSALFFSTSITVIFMMLWISERGLNGKYVNVSILSIVRWRWFSYWNTSTHITKHRFQVGFLRFITLWVRRWVLSISTAQKISIRPFIDLPPRPMALQTGWIQIE